MKRKYKRMLIAEEVLMDILINAVKDVKDMPPDVVGAGVYYDQSRKCFDLTLYSDEYQEIPIGGVIKIISPVFVKAPEC